jgi:hypothetical protein
MGMSKYVLRHGGLSLGKENATPGAHLRPSADPLSPTVVELTEREAAAINGHVWDEKAGKLVVDEKGKPVSRPTQLLHNATDDGPALVLLAEYEADRAGAKAAADAKAKVLGEHAAKKADEKPKGGKS